MWGPLQAQAARLHVVIGAVTPRWSAQVAFGGGLQSDPGVRGLLQVQAARLHGVIGAATLRWLAQAAYLSMICVSGAVASPQAPNLPVALHAPMSTGSCTESSNRGGITCCFAVPAHICMVGWLPCDMWESCRLISTTIV